MTERPKSSGIGGSPSEASKGLGDLRTLESAAVFLKLMRASGGVTNRVFGQLPGGASAGQFVVLEALHTLGPMRQSDLAYKILKTTGNVTQMVDRLEQDGLVMRTRSDTDRRVVVVGITDKGRRKVERLMPYFMRAVAKEFEVLTDDELSKLGDLCRKLGLGRFVSFLTSTHPLTQVIPFWASRVQNITHGLVSVSWKGGPEEIRPTEQVDAVIRGDVDGAFVATSWYGALAPELQAMNLSQFTPWEERENGLFDWIARRHEAMGVVYLGRWMTNLPFYVWAGWGITHPRELAGVRVRVRAGHSDRFLECLGATPVDVDPNDVAHAVESGEVDACVAPVVGVREQGWAKRMRYVIDHGFYAPQNATILMNVRAWSRLTLRQQEAVHQATGDFEREVAAHFRRREAAERRELEQQGVTFVRFDPEVAAEFSDMADEAIWTLLDEQTPDLVPEIRRLVTRR